MLRFASSQQPLLLFLHTEPPQYSLQLCCKFVLPVTQLSVIFLPDLLVFLFPCILVSTPNLPSYCCKAYAYILQKKGISLKKGLMNRSRSFACPRVAQLHGRWMPQTKPPHHLLECQNVYIFNLR